jgi:hypothetical protein
MDNTAEKLKPCPFCGKDLEVHNLRFNPYARCATEGCKGSQLPLLNIDIPSDIEAWNTRADSGEAVAWLVESEKAGRVSSELHELSADKVIADVVREYGDAYGATTKRPLFTHPRRVTADEVRDASRLEWLDEQVKQGTRIEFAKGLFGNSVEIGLRSPPRAFVQDTVRDAIDVALARCGEGANGRR